MTHDFCTHFATKTISTLLDSKKPQASPSTWRLHRLHPSNVGFHRRNAPGSSGRLSFINSSEPSGSVSDPARFHATVASPMRRASCRSGGVYIDSCMLTWWTIWSIPTPCMGIHEACLVRDFNSPSTTDLISCTL